MNMNRIVFNVICAFVFLMNGYAQDGTYRVIGVTGNIVNQQSGKALQANEQVNSQTTLLFGNPSDKAIVLSSSQERYRLELPAESNQLAVSFDKSLREIKSRPLLATGTRGLEPISPEGLKKYFGTDTFAIIGSSLNMQAKKSDLQKFDLIFRFEENDKIRDVTFGDFVIRQNVIGLSQVNECFILLRENDKITPVTEVALLFLNEQNLFQEFAIWLNAKNIKKSSSSDARKELRQYCRDVYGVMDNSNLNDVINRFLSSK